ncbi:D-alanyl-D-alanine carboxypeptidase [Acinetobacter sp. LoGeW2-3]|nr:D-alanyl-D-alanine carboxypeptidase [Acinetobacter sp. LoGeW2-3]
MLVLVFHEFRTHLMNLFTQILPYSKNRILAAKHVSWEFNLAASSEKIQSHWHIQQWWILLAALLLFSSIVIFTLTRPITASTFEANYLRKVDPQIYTLLDGQVLAPPPEVEEYLIEEALQAEANYYANVISAQVINPLPNPAEDVHLPAGHSHSDISSADRKWNKINPRYKQRLLMVFKIMREQHGYELVLLEGYRSPERQNSLSVNPNTTRAKGYQSYHQFGLAADVAFKRNGKVVISERDPWAMRGYELYGQIAESVGLTWGGRWKSIKDYGHTEYRMPGLRKTAEMANQLINEGQLQASAN